MNPIRLRPTTKDSIGTTAFFRNRILFNTLFNELKACNYSEVTVLFHACSIGAEVYSFVIQYYLGGYDRYFNLKVHATDHEKEFVNYAFKGEYPAKVVKAFKDEEIKYFDFKKSLFFIKNKVSIKNKVKRHVHFLDAKSFTEFETIKKYNVVFLLNAFVYVEGSMQSKTIDKICKYNTDFFVTTAFHMDQIKDDLQRNSYLPVLTNQVEIHNGWKDRRIDSISGELNPQVYADWRLPVFSKVDSFEYRYCSIFSKRLPRL